MSAAEKCEQKKEQLLESVNAFNWAKIGGVAGTIAAGYLFQSGLAAVGFFVAYFAIDPVYEWFKR